MAEEKKAEFWLSGPIEGITPLLQPVAHAILQSQREVNEELRDFPGYLLWERPGGVASIGFHLQHLAGMPDRLFTYAKGDPLTPSQLESLQQESLTDEKKTIGDLLEQFNNRVRELLAQLTVTPEQSVLETRYVGRKKIPSNTLGLLFHTAEHMQRHTGQLIVTARILKSDARQ